jgi:hypothetical protein
VTNGDRLKRVWGYALGMIEESGWILAMTVFAFLMALVAKWIWP